MATAWTRPDRLRPSALRGRPGTIGTRAGNSLGAAAGRLRAAIGSRLNIRQASYNWDSFARHAHRIQVDVDEAELRKPRCSRITRWWPTLLAFLQALARQPLATLPDFRDWRQWVQAVQRQHPAPHEPSNTSAEGLINPTSSSDRCSQLPGAGLGGLRQRLVCIMPFQVGRLKAGQRPMSVPGSASWAGICPRRGRGLGRPGAPRGVPTAMQPADERARAAKPQDPWA